MDLCGQDLSINFSYHLRTPFIADEATKVLHRIFRLMKTCVRQMLVEVGIDRIPINGKCVPHGSGEFDLELNNFNSSKNITWNKYPQTWSERNSLSAPICHLSATIYVLLSTCPKRLVYINLQVTSNIMRLVFHSQKSFGSRTGRDENLFT